MMKPAGTRDVVPFILCGGSGTRLWPVSRPGMPKQFQSFVGDRTLLQDTILRVAAPGFAPTILIGADEHRTLMDGQFAGLPASRGEGVRTILEPSARNTAAAALAAALVAAETDPDALVLLMPADHYIRDAEAFRAMVEDGREAADSGALVLFGLVPDRPETGYGYIDMGQEPVPGPGSAARNVARFVEKPDLPNAERMLAAGHFVWNSGIFLFQASAMIREAEEHQPELLAGVRAAIAAGTRRDGDLLLDPAIFGAVTSISVDYAIMERTTRAAVVPTSLGWSDLGAWDAIQAAHAPDQDGNVSVGRTVLVDTTNTMVRSSGPVVATIGLQDLIVVATGDSVLVADRNKAQSVKQVVDALKTLGLNSPHKEPSMQNGQDPAQLTAREVAQHGEVLHAPIVERPWGTYQSVLSGTRFQVKLITVNPGGRLSLQKHHHRAEHWVVVQGAAEITCGEKVFMLYENQSTFIPQGETHRLANPGRTPLHLIEVQSGGYLGEDDIIRVEDIYGRA